MNLERANCPLFHPLFHNGRGFDAPVHWRRHPMRGIGYGVTNEWRESARRATYRCVLFKSKSGTGAADSAKAGPFGKFHLRELINSGGMADIWLATDKDQKTYALRRLHDDLRFDFLARKRFVRGCEILSKIHNHDCVIGYFEHGKIDGSLYLLMEYVEGLNLKELYLSHDPVLLENVGNIIIDMATGLEHVHESGFMHLDFKPENVLVTRNGNVRLADFDLAQPIPKRPKKMSKNPGTP